MKKIILLLLIVFFVFTFNSLYSYDLTLLNNEEFRTMSDVSFGYIIMKNKNLDNIKADIAGVKAKISEFNSGEVLFVQLLKYGFIFKKYRATIIVKAQKEGLAELFSVLPWDCDFFDKAAAIIDYESTKIVNNPGTPATPNHPATPPTTEHKPVYSSLKVTFDDIDEALLYFKAWKDSDAWEFLRKNDYWGFHSHISNINHHVSVSFYSSHSCKKFIFDSIFPIKYQKVSEIVGEEILELTERYYK